MPKLIEYFQNDFQDLCIEGLLPFTLQKVNHLTNEKTEQIIEIKQRLEQNMKSSTRLFTFYVPETEATLDICLTLLNNLEEYRKQVNDVIAIGSWNKDICVGTHQIVYSNRIYFYTETLLAKEAVVKLEELAKQKTLYLTIRSSDYIDEKIKLETPLAFISHDSRDKDLIARPLSSSLSSRLCKVWYDEYSLKIGDSLRESIEQGIKEAKKCILILTPNYLNNPGWGKKEFNSIFTREMIMEEKIVLPIWYGVTKKEVYEYSPSLADTFALTWTTKDDKTVEQYNQETEKLISKIHTAITT